LLLACERTKHVHSELDKLIIHLIENFHYMKRAYLNVEIDPGYMHDEKQMSHILKDKPWWKIYTAICPGKLHMIMMLFSFHTLSILIIQPISQRTLFILPSY